MATSNNNIGLTMLAGLGTTPEKTVTPREIYKDGSPNLEHGYWRGNTEKGIKDKFDVLLEFEGSGVYAGKPEIIIAGSGLNTADNCSSFSAGTYEWLDGVWEEIATDDCDYQDGCTKNPPAYSGSGDGLGGETAIGTCTGGSTTSRYAIEGGTSFWQKAGSLNSLSDQVPQQTSIYLSKSAYLNMGSGVVNTGAFTVYTKVLPSGDTSDTVIMAKHKKDPASFVLGCDFDGRYYIRSDAMISGVPVAQYAKSSRRFDSYAMPSQVMGQYDGERLKIYVNGELENQSGAFTRAVGKSANTDLILGKKESPFNEKSFRGWYDEIAVVGSAIPVEDIHELYSSQVRLAKYMQELVPPTGGAIEGQAFSNSFNATDKDYIQFVVSSGVGAAKARGGAYDLWSHTQNAVSSVFDISVPPLPRHFHQLKKVSVDMWVENNTTHQSGVNLTAKFIRKTANTADIKWDSNMVYLPSGDKKLITFSGVLPHFYFRHGSLSYKSTMEDHKLRLGVHYPDMPTLYDAEFKIYSTRMRFESLDTFSKLNTQSGIDNEGFDLLDDDGNFIGRQKGPKNLLLNITGGEYVQSSGIFNLFVMTEKAVQSMPLVINRDSESALGNSGIGTLLANAGITRNSDMNLYVRGGEIERRLHLFLQTDEFTPTSNTANLYAQGDTNVVPYAQHRMPLFISPVANTGLVGSNMNIVMPNVGNAFVNDRRLLYTAGHFNKTTPLFMKVNEGLNTSRDLYLLAPNNYQASGSMNLVMKREDFYSTSSIIPRPSLLTNKNINMFLKGLGAPSGTFPLTMPNVIGSGDKTLNLYTGGYRR